MGLPSPPTRSRLASQMSVTCSLGGSWLGMAIVPSRATSGLSWRSRMSVAFATEWFTYTTDHQQAEPRNLGLEATRSARLTALVANRQQSTQAESDTRQRTEWPQQGLLMTHQLWLPEA